MLDLNPKILKVLEKLESIEAAHSFFNEANIIKKNIKKLSQLFTNENTFLINVHMFDATTTFVALTYFPYFEQHVLPGFLISIFGPVVMYALKLVVVSVVLYYFDKELSKPQDMEKRTFLKIIVLILGLGPGLRNFLRMIMGV